MSPALIKDRFSKRVKDRKARYRLRHKAAGLCVSCGERRAERSAWHCERHLEAQRYMVEVRRRLAKAAKEAAGNQQGGGSV